MRLHAKTMASIRNVAEETFDGTCRIFYQEESETEFGVGKASVEFFVTDDIASNEYAFFTGIDISADTNSFPCRVQGARVEDIKSLDVSTDKLLFWVFLPWYLGEADKYRIMDGKTGILQLGGQILVDTVYPQLVSPYADVAGSLGRLEIEQLMSVNTYNRAQVRLLASQRGEN